MWTILPTLQEVDSTNTYMKSHANELRHCSIVRAEYQSAGRGQFDRQWESSCGENLLFSMLLKSQPISSLGAMRTWLITSLITWLATFQINGVFKQPNDILVDGKKILGILIETRQSNEELQWIVIGIGININQLQFQYPLATSLRALTQQEHSIEQCFLSLTQQLAEHYPL